MAAEIDKIFTATAKSTWHFLIENGQGCYIPAYQRPYAWDNENISRLFEDVLHGIRQITHRPDTISFLGTIIAIHDTKYRTVDPIYHSEVAPRVMTIIDGQQRICTAIMSNMALHDYIRCAVATFKSKTEPHLFWIAEECSQLLADLRNTYIIDRASGDNNYRYYPRVIRAYSDAWSRRQGQAKYESPMAKLIWEYIDFTESRNTSQFKFNPVDSGSNLIDQHKMVHDAFHFIQLEIQRICQSNPDRYDFPDLVTATQEADFSEGIWGFPLPEQVKKYVAEESGDSHYDRFCHLLRLIIFARYFNHRVAITVVTAGNEDDAFDMFEALNTTGEPLTAFETFKPKVIDLETLAKYEHSPSYKWIIQIEEYLDRYRKADAKQRATSEMLVPFALAETGWKLQKKLNDQRRYLRDEFDKLSKLNDIEKNRAFVRSVAGVASFMRDGWDVERGISPNFAPLKIDDEEALVGFEALRGLKHSITIAPLSRFYQHALDATQDADRKHRTEEFMAAIKATVAFSFLWRGAMGGTENIDSHYRDIMRSGINMEGEVIPPLARRPNGKSGALSLTNYKRALRLVLQHKGKIKTKEEWVKEVSRISIYRYPIVARFLVFCASDDAVPDKAEKGLVEKGRKGISPLLMLSQWNNEAYFTIEHIAPQSPGAGWDDGEIYSQPQTVDTLGNLTLLPKEENNVIGNKSWEHKRLMYSLLSAETQSEFDDIECKLSSVGLTLSKTADEVLKNATYLGLCKSVALYDQKWSLTIIEKRTQRFAELAWDRLAPWLFS
jgi:uncharacterized protein DUF262/uncharacterized protein DUF1524